MRFNVITIFPKIISDYCDETILNRAQKNNLIKINPINLRDFTDDNHKTVALRQAQDNFEPRRKVALRQAQGNRETRRTIDDTPYGGGAGMVMKPEPIFKALSSLGALSEKRNKDTRTQDTNNIKYQISNIKNFVEASYDVIKKIIARKRKKTILLSPRGRQFDQRMAEQLAKLDEITFVCGRYEGVDQRVSDFMVDEEISIGPYILAGGELGALIIIEAVSRLIPGVLGNEESLNEETFGSEFQNAECRMQNSEIGDSEIKNLQSEIEYAQYTKPANFRGWKVPEVLLSGDHKKIEEWRKQTQDSKLKN